MDPGVDDSRRLALVVVVVVIAVLVSTVGLRTLTGNPAVPDLETTVTGTESFGVDRPGEVRIATIEHAGGDPVAFVDLSVVIGTRADGLVFSTDTNWTSTAGPLTYRLDRSPGADQFGPGDRVVLRKVDGTFRPAPTVNVTVRLLHRPSQRTLDSHDLTFRSSESNGL